MTTAELIAAGYNITAEAALAEIERVRAEVLIDASVYAAKVRADALEEAARLVEMGIEDRPPIDVVDEMLRHYVEAIRALAEKGGGR